MKTVFERHAIREFTVVQYKTHTTVKKQLLSLKLKEKQSPRMFKKIKLRKEKTKIDLSPSI